MKLADELRQCQSGGYAFPSSEQFWMVPTDLYDRVLDALSNDRAPADVEGLVEEGVQAALDGGYAVNGQHGVAAARVSARHVASVLQAEVSRLETERDELKFWLRKAGEVLSPHSADALGTPTREALVFVNAGINPQARERVRATLTEPLSKYGHGSAGTESAE